MRKCYTIAMVVLLPLFTFGQGKKTGTVGGKILDSASRQPLADATVAILRTADSSFVRFVLANNNGEFAIGNLRPDSLCLVVSFQGYENARRNFVLTAQRDFDFGNILLQRRSELLGEVIVQRPPVVYKKDTLEFNAGSFKTRPNASAEDLLKTMPGFQIDKQGNIKAQGEAVQKVYVDGKEFFGNDPKFATRNITANMIESVQLYDETSEQARFTRIDDGSRQKAINLKLKKEYKKGYFGRATLGGGSDERYDADFNLNRFNGDQRLSVLASANNVNKVGFAFGDVMSAVGGFSNIARGLSAAEGGKFSIDGFGGGNNLQLSSMRGSSPSGAGTAGITNSIATGINFTDQLGRKVDFNGSYFYSRPETQNQSRYIRQNIFPNDSASTEYRFSDKTTLNQNHTANLRFEYYADSMNSFLNKTTISVQRSGEQLSDSTTSYSITGDFPYKALAGINSNDNSGRGIGLNNTFLYRHKLKRPGRTFTFRWTNNTTRITGNSLVYTSLNTYNEDGMPQPGLLQNFKTGQEVTAFDNVLNGTYTEPIGGNKLLEVNYAYVNNQSVVDREAFDFNGFTGKYDSLNALQTIYFSNNFHANRLGAHFRWPGKKFDFQVGASVQQSTQTLTAAASKNAKDSMVRRHYTNLLPMASFNYRVSNAARLNISYRGRTIFPTITQLQPTPDMSDPLYIREGNAMLKPEFSNTLSINYTSFNIANFNFLSANINIANSLNKIVNSIDSTGEPGVLRIRPVNVDGNFNLLSFLVYGIPLKNKLQGSNLNLSLSAIYNRQNNLLYKKNNRTETWMITQGISSNLDFNTFNLFISAGLTYNRATYSSNTQFNRDYFTQNSSAELTYSLWKDYLVGIDFDYFNNTDNTGFNPSIFLLNGSISRMIFKNKNGEIRLSVNDILNQNKSFIRRIGDNYIEDNNSLVLKRYFLLTFVYRFNKPGQAPASDGLPKPFKRQVDQLRISY